MPLLRRGTWSRRARRWRRNRARSRLIRLRAGPLNQSQEKVGFPVQHFLCATAVLQGFIQYSLRQRCLLLPPPAFLARMRDSLPQFLRCETSRIHVFLALAHTCYPGRMARGGGAVAARQPVASFRRHLLLCTCVVLPHQRSPYAPSQRGRRRWTGSQSAARKHPSAVREHSANAFGYGSPLPGAAAETWTPADLFARDTGAHAHERTDCVGRGRRSRVGAGSEVIDGQRVRRPTVAAGSGLRPVTCSRRDPARARGPPDLKKRA